MNELQNICNEIEQHIKLEACQHERRMLDFTDSAIYSQIVEYHKGFMSGLRLAKTIVESRILMKEYIEKDIEETANMIAARKESKV